MDYVEYPAPASLQRHVQCVWLLRDPLPDAGIQAVYADGRCELIAHLAEPMTLHRPDGGSERQAATLFAGQQRGPVRLQATGAVHCLGVRLAPAASALVAGGDLPGYRDGIVDLRRLDAAFADHFADAARQFALSARAGGLWELLAERCRGLVPDSAVETAVATLDGCQGSARIATLAQATGLGARSLQARFLAAIGMTAKEYARVRRLHALLQALDNDDTPLAQVVADHGFADQSHATRDLGRLTGTTPARLLRALRNHRDSDEALRLATAFVRGGA